MEKTIKIVGTLYAAILIINALLHVLSSVIDGHTVWIVAWTATLALTIYAASWVRDMFRETK